MSFYVYHGKLENEVLVAVLPNGTVEHGDPIHLYTKKKFTSYTAKNVSVNDDGEDVVAFNDGYYTYEAVSKRSYKELSLTIKGGNAKASKVALTRHYDQPLTAIPLSDPPRIWTGVIDFHEWAKNESIFVIAPKGLGNGKPIVSIWQWTKDAQGTKDTLSYATDKQQSENATPTTFSFKQNGYYTLNCKVNAATSGLSVTIKSPSNPDAVLKELNLSAKIEIGAEHTFAPPRSLQKQITLDCSLPRAAASLPRITGALPFPADLLTTLAHSAAYVDQAGYLAKYAVKQFNQLDQSFQQLEKKAELRATKIGTLEGDILKLTETNRVQESEFKALQKQLMDHRAAAKKRENDLVKQLAETSKALADSQTQVEEQQAYIDADKLADIAREKAHRKHDREDHKAIDLVTNRLKESLEREECLQNESCKKDRIIAGHEASLKTLRQQLCDKETNIAKLTSEINVLKGEKSDLEKKLVNEKYLHDIAKADLLTAQEVIAAKDKSIKTLEKNLAQKQKNLDSAEEDLKHAQTDLEHALKDVNHVREDLKRAVNRTNEAKAELKETELQFSEYKTTHESEYQKINAELKKLKDHDKGHHTTVPKAPVTATVTEICN